MKKNFLLLTLIMAGALYATEKPTLTVYTYDSFAASWGPAPKIKEAFEKECNCTLNFVASSSAIGTLRKIQMEGSRTKADVLLGLDTSIALTAKATKLFEKHSTDTSKVVLPKDWNDDTFVPFDYSYFAFVYDMDKLKKVPTSFEELVSMPKGFKIVIQDPRSSTPGLGLLLWVKSVYGDKAAEYWKRLSPHILTITKGWSEAYGLFLKGEADMVLSYTTSPAYHIIAEEKTNYLSADFKEGHYGQIEVAAMLKSSKNKELAQKFLQFMLSDTFQDIIPTTNWTYPVVKTKKGLPNGFSTLKVPSKMILMDSQKVKENKKLYVDEWIQAVAK
ncbi:MAG: thiamine ABC transporter substrate binding subunit [Sulfurovum sp.]|nr:thiamine ABC transporter substrate binding subunit [Sulfurovum sp.]